MEERTYAVVLDAVEEKLRNGELRVGDKLPSERALAEEHGISRASVREAVRIMDAMGLVRSRTGSGPRAGAVVSSEPSAALAWGLRMHLASRALPVADVVETRVQLESAAAARAAEKSQGPEGSALAEAAGLLDRLDEPDLPDEQFHDLDARFHRVLSGIGGNVVAETMLDSLHQATVGYVREGVLQLEDWPAVRRRLQEQHRGILDAVAAGAPEDAADRVTRHIRWFHETAFAG